MNKKNINYNGMEIAVIGMSGKFPGAKNLDEYWDNIKNGKESIKFFSDEELRQAGVSSELINNPSYVKAKGVLEGIDYFDANFFGYTPKDAQIMDPQMRLFHECCYEALEDAGCNPDSYKGLIGIYAGAKSNINWQINTLSVSASSAAEKFANLQLNDKDYMCSRIAYKLNFRGPSLTVNSASSTSLVAIDLACESLLMGKCDVALAGGVRLSIPQISGYLYQEGMIFSNDGHCRSFDADASGTVIGEGVGVVVLKRLEDAIADNDNIYAIVKGSFVNNDGTRKVGFTAPGVEGEAEAIKSAYVMADVEPESVSYIEAHGTATPIGDPIEIEALKMAFDTDKTGFCAIGSVKANIGHLDAAAGVAGFIKTVLALKNKQIPPSINFSSPNPSIDFKNSPFYVNTKLTYWNESSYPRRAGVSSFGIGGANSHVILEEAPMQESTNDYLGHNIVTLSAKTRTALLNMENRLLTHIKKNSINNLNDIAYTLNTGRKEFKYRKSIVCSDVDELTKKLSSNNVEGTYSTLAKDNNNIVFMFPGQGSQYVNMARELYDLDTTFKNELDLCFESVKSIADINLKDIIFGDDTENRMIYQTSITQPLLFSFEYSLAKTLIKWGISPNAMIGHSIGEYVAACLAGVFSVNDALSLVILRGKLMQSLPEGSMLSVPFSCEELMPLINENLSIAALNSSKRSVVSGPDDAISAFEQLLSDKGISSIRVRTSHAFHSMMMDPILKEFEEKVKKIKLNKPNMPYISNLTGTWINNENALDPKYWVKHLRHTVRFNEGLDILLNQDRTIFIEVGPGKTLCTFVKEHEKFSKVNKVLNTLRHPKVEVSDFYFLLSKLGILWCEGVKIDWDMFYSNQNRHKMALPTYPFEKKSFWYQGNAQIETQVSKNGLIEVRNVENEIAQDSDEDQYEIDDMNDRNELSTEYIKAGSELEKSITEIWEDFFGIRKIGIIDNFFELGGDSLKASIVIARIQEQLGHDIPLHQIFVSPTIKGLCDYLISADVKEYDNIPIAPVKEYYELSSTQKRFYALNQLKGIETAFNMPVAMIIEGCLDVERFKKVFDELINRHDSLHISIEQREGRPVLIFNEKLDFKVEYSESPNESVEDIIRKSVKVFELDKPPLIRVKLVKINEEKFVWFFDAHLICMDYKSRRMLFDEFVHLYKGDEIQPPKVEYKDFTEWQQKIFKEENLQNEDKYWKSVFEKDTPVLKMPIDYKRTERLTYETEILKFSIDKNLISSIEKELKINNYTPYMFVYSLYSILLHKYSGQYNIVLWSGVAGRNNIDLDKIIGSFAYSIPMKISIDTQRTMKEHLKYVKEILLNAYDHQYYPIERLFEDSLHEARDSMISFTNQSDSDIDFNIQGLKFTQVDYINKIKDRDIRMTVDRNNLGDYWFYLTYNVKLFNKDTVYKFANNLKVLIQKFKENSEQRICDINLFDEKEYEEIKSKREIN